VRFRTILFVVVLIAVGTAGFASVFAAPPVTSCPPALFQCGFSAAQTKPLGSGSPGRPDMTIGYLVFDGAGIPTIFAQTSKDGTLQPLNAITGTCTGTTDGTPGTLDFTGGLGPKLAFVTFKTGDLRFITTELNNGLANVIQGSCIQL
jgi:hypothetical protein